MGRHKAKITTNTSPLSIRTNPSTKTGSRNGSLAKGSTVIINEIVQPGGGWIWFKLEDGRGYCCSVEPGVGKWATIIEDLNPPAPPAPPPPPPKAIDNSDLSQGLDSKIYEMIANQSKKTFSDLDVSTRLFGSPFQFMKTVDLKLNSKVNMGRKFLENISSNAPIVYFIPGKPNYLPDVSEVERSGMAAYFADQKMSSDGKSIIDKIFAKDEDIRYFDFVSDYGEYTKYVNLLCRVCAIYMGIGDRTAPNSKTKYRYYDWSNYKYGNDFKEANAGNDQVFDKKDWKETAYDLMFGSLRYTQFYVDPSSSFSESASNNTTSSKMEGLFDSAEGIVKELAFLTNTAALKNVDEARQSFAKGIDSIADKMLKNSNENFFTRLLGMSSSVLSGANLIFPELWGDAAYNKSYNITMNLKSPYGDKESIFLNVMVPLMHILALALPKQANSNAYASPFLLKAFAKGWFSCELGIIDSVSIDKGIDGSWSVDGLPQEVRVSIGVKDLYSNLMITSTSRPRDFMQNQGLIDFLAVTCGVDVVKPNLMLKFETLTSIMLGKVHSLPSDFYKQFIEAIQKQLEGIFKL